MVADTVYLTPAEWQNMTLGVDFSDLQPIEAEALIANASLSAEEEAGLVDGGSWLSRQYLNESHYWRHGSRRVYLWNWPVISLDEIRIRVGAHTAATIQGTEVYTSNTGRYIEVSALALAFGIAPDIVSLGLAEPIVEVDYTAGYETIPNDIKYAVAIIATANYLNKKVIEEGSGGVVSYTVGSYMVTYAMRGGGATPVGGVSGFGNVIPEAAKTILRHRKAAPFLR